MSIETPLLDLTPVYLQNTDNIVNTLIFMNVDQGHDFHDGSARTKTNSGNQTWVDLDFKGKGFLNSIPREIFNRDYSQNEGDPRILNSDKIFGQTDFIKGSINTTFVGGNGAYAFVVINDDNLKLLQDVNFKDIVIQKINETITINIQNTGQKYYIFAENDTQGELGLTFNFGDETNPIEAMFLPFYQRVYNGNMHKLWTFDTIKHIYLIKLKELQLTNSSTELKITNPVFTCEEFTTINLIIPQYKINFNTFLNGEKGSTKTLSNSVIEKISEETLAELPKKRGKIDFSNMDEFPEEVKKIILNLFLCELVTGNNCTIDEVADSEGQLRYEDGKFKLNVRDIDIIQNIPRGAKYYFENCQTSVFQKFLKLLYESEKPFIHPQYQCSKTEEDMNRIKDEISTLLSSKIEHYTQFKNNQTIVPDDDRDFISKQYGFITDTNIGSYADESTADYIIDSLNNSQPDTSQRGGALEFLNGIDGVSSIVLNTIKASRQYNPRIKPEIKQVMRAICPLMNREDLKTQFISYLKTKFSLTQEQEEEINGMMKCGIDKSQPESQPAPVFLKQPSSSPRTDIETRTLESDTAPSAPEDMELQPEAKAPSAIGDVEVFDNIANVNELFNLNLNKQQLSTPPPFIKINSKTATVQIDEYVNKYSNDLQLYYNYKQQNQTTEEITNNYFNNCWQSIDFYQEGGADYPFKFTVASGSLDSSSLGGQSIPQYHPPEIDIYMPIFNLSGQTSNLKGVIIRMVVVKEILNNQINSKSKVAVFCHFVYVDFDRTGIPPPTQDADGNDTISEYPEKFKALLEFSIQNTRYVKNETECVNLNSLNLETLNADENIDFKLYNLKDNSGGKTFKRNWYKYYTASQGPTVKDSIVIPVNYSTIQEIELGVAFDNVASGIVDVAKNLIGSSAKLRAIFGENNKTFFVKLFLVRNKYTGDKSRSTDSLFLNQSKYLEGVQISNDENTLYNAQMFGLNTVWSTSQKSVFYMTPYLTKEGKLPITTAAYIEKLNEGLKSNPNIKSSISGPKGESEKHKLDTISQIKKDIQEDLIKNINPNFIINYQDAKSKGAALTDLYFSGSFLSVFVDIIYTLQEGVYNELDKFIIYCDSLDEIMQKCVSNFDKSCSDLFYNDTLEQKKINFPLGTFSADYKKIAGNISSLKKDYNKAYSLLVNVKVVLKTWLDKNRNIDADTRDKYENTINLLYDTILYLSKIAPWWLDKILDDKLNILKHYCCKTYKMVMNQLNTLKEKTEEKLRNQHDEIEIKNLRADLDSYNSYIRIIPNKIRLLLTENCDDLQNYPESSNDYLKEYIPKSPSDTDYNAEIELNNLKRNEAMFKYASTQFLKKIKEYDSRSPSLDLKKIGDANDTTIMGKTDAELKLADLFTNIRQSRGDRSTGPNGGKKRLYDDLESENLAHINIMPINNKRAMFEPANNPKSIYLLPPPPVKNEETHNEEIHNDIQENKEKDDGNLEVDNEAAGLMRVDAEPISSQQKFSPEELTIFFENSYKCNVGNRIKNYIELINKIQSTYGKLNEENDDNPENEDMIVAVNEDENQNHSDDSLNMDDNSTNGDMPASKNSKLMIIKIFLKNIDFINKSFYPNINYQIIIDNFSRVDDIYSVSKMNSLLDIYSSQLEMYSLIGDIMNSNDDEDTEDNNNYTRRQLAEIFDNSISDITLNSIGIPYNKYEIEKKILLGLGDDEFVPQANDIHNEVEMPRDEEEMHQDDETTNIDGGNNKKRKNTKKRRNNKKIIKTRNNKKQNKKKTIKKRNMKHKKHSRKH